LSGETILTPLRHIFFFSEQCRMGARARTVSRRVRALSEFHRRNLIAGQLLHRILHFR
jgi:hypothetical protein